MNDEKTATKDGNIGSQPVTLERDNDEAKKSAIEVGLDSSLLVLIVSVSAYIFAHFWLKSYLQFFNFDETVLYVDLQTIVLAGGALVATLTSVYLIFSKFPAVLLKRLFGLMAAYQGSVFPFVIFLGMHERIGYTWLTVAAGFFAALLIFTETWILFSRIRSEGSLSRALDLKIESAKNALDGTLENSIDRAFGTQPITILLVFLLAPYLFGGVLGHRFADGKRDFLTFTDDNKSYIVVWTQSDSVFASQIEFNSERDQGTLTSNPLVLSSADLKDRPLEYVSSITINRVEDMPVRVSFMEFWSNSISVWWK